MAILISKADGNLTGAATFAQTEAGGAVTTHTAGASGGATSPTFTGTNGNTTDGVVLWVQRTTTLGTCTVSLLKGGVAVATVTVNMADLPSQLSPVFFKFTSTHTFDGSSTYAVLLGGTQSLNYAYSGSGVNPAKILRLTATAAPASGDVLMICGELTGAGTNSPRAVTMDNTSTSFSLGTNVQSIASVPHTVPNGIEIGHLGTLAYGTAAATAYYLKMQGHVQVWGGGSLNIGTAASPIPSDSSAVLEFNNDANVKFGLEVLDGGTVNMRGNAIANVKAKLAANAAAAAVSLTTDISTAWKSGDLIGIAPTSRTASEAESRTLSADAVGTSLSVPALTNTHDGTGAVQAELINLTRNVKVRGISTTNQSYVNAAATAVWSTRYVEFSNLGSTTSGKRGIDVGTTTGSFDAQYCALHDLVAASSAGFLLSSGSSNNVTLAHNVSYNIQSTHYSLPATTGSNILLDDNTAIKNIGSVPVFNILDVGITFTNNVAAGGAGVGITITEAAAVTGTFGGNVAHSNAGVGASLINLLGGSVGSVTAWRNNSHGASIDSCKNLTVDGLTSFGNNISNLLWAQACFAAVLKNATLYSEGSFATAIGTRFDAVNADISFENCSFGSGGTHSTGDVSVSAGTFLTLTLSNSLLTSPTEVANPSNLLTGSYIRSAKHDQVQDSHKTWLREGTIQIDTTLGDPATPSSRLTPSSASSKLKSAKKQVPCASGQQVTVSIEVRKSVVGDGTAYNGAQPRLVVEKNVAAGLAADTVLATAAAAAGQWETLTAQLPAPTDDCVYTIFVDCDGTAGWVNIDHIRLTNSAANASGTMKYWRDGLPFNGIDPGGRSGVDFLYWLDGLPSSLLFPMPGAVVAGITAGEAEGAATAAALPSTAAVAGVSSGEAEGAAAFAPGALLASAGGIFSAEAEGVGALLPGVSLAVVAGIASDEGEGAPSASPPLLRKTPLLAKLLSANRRRALIR